MSAYFAFINYDFGEIFVHSPEMAKYVREYNLGLMTKDFFAEDLTKQLIQ
jgi:hypothetical protein